MSKVDVIARQPWVSAWRNTCQAAAIGAVCCLGLSACRHAARTIDTPADLVSCVRATLAEPGVLASINAFEVAVDSEPEPGNRTSRPDHTTLALDASGAFRWSSTMEYLTPGLKTSTRQCVDGRATVTMSDDTGSCELTLDSEEQTIVSLRNELARWMFILFWRETPARRSVALDFSRRASYDVTSLPCEVGIIVRVLVVEDDPGERSLFAGSLAACEYEVIEAATRAQALATLRFSFVVGVMTTSQFRVAIADLIGWS